MDIDKINKDVKSKFTKLIANLQSSSAKSKVLDTNKVIQSVKETQEAVMKVLDENLIPDDEDDDDDEDY